MCLGFGENAPLQIATDVDLEAEPVASIDELHREQRLIRLATRQRVAVP